MRIICMFVIGVVVMMGDTGCEAQFWAKIRDSKWTWAISFVSVWKNPMSMEHNVSKKIRFVDHLQGWPEDSDLPPRISKIPGPPPHPHVARASRTALTHVTLATASDRPIGAPSSTAARS